MSRLRPYTASLLALVCAVLAAGWAWSLRGSAEKPALPLVQSTSREDLDATERLARARIAADDTDAPGAVRLAEILLRKVRVETDAGHAIEAEQVLENVLDSQPGEYSALLQGRLREALRHMQMAAGATSAHDPESLAWHHTQVGNILFQMGRVDAASRKFARAQHVFPDHPYARAGLARVAAARGA